jgi:stress-induced morphogen
MTETAVPIWDAKRTDESRTVENLLRNVGGFAQADAYRYNLASIRVRVIDPRFEGMSLDQRDSMIEPCLKRLPDRTYGDIIALYAFTPSEMLQTPQTFWEYTLNREFDDPSPSVL